MEDTLDALGIEQQTIHSIGSVLVTGNERRQKMTQQQKNNALLCQDIISFIPKTGITDFKLIQLENWLIENNSEFVEDFSDTRRKKIPKSSKRSIKDQRIRARLGDLVNLGLLFEKRKVRAEKVDVEVPVFALAPEGYFIYYLLQREYPKKYEYVNNEIYEIIQSSLKAYDSSWTLFLSLLYAAYREANILDKVIDVIRDRLKNGNLIRVFDAILNIITYTQIRNVEPKLKKKLLQIYLTVLRSEANRTGYPVILQTIKLNHELHILSHCPSKRWEKIWIRYINDYSKTVLNLQCDRCQSLAPFVVDTIEVITNPNVKTRCLICASTKLISSPEVVDVKPISMVQHAGSSMAKQME